MPDPADPLKPLERWITARDHESASFAFPLPPAQERTSVVLGACLAALVPLTLLLLGYPGARFFESQGWWLVNEAVMARRWLGYGTPIALGLFVCWLPFRPAGARLRVDRHRLVLRRWLRRPIEVRLASVRRVVLDPDGCLLLARGDQLRTRTDGSFVLGPGDVKLPHLPLPPSAAVALVDVIRDHLRPDEGDATAVPRALHRVVREADP